MVVFLSLKRNMKVWVFKFSYFGFENVVLDWGGVFCWVLVEGDVVDCYVMYKVLIFMIVIDCFVLCGVVVLYCYIIFLLMYMVLEFGLYVVGVEYL